MNQMSQNCLDIMKDALLFQKECSEDMFNALTEFGIADVTAMNFVNGVIRDISSGKKSEELLPVYRRITDDLLEHMRGIKAANPLLKDVFRTVLHATVCSFVTSVETTNTSYTKAVLMMVKAKNKEGD